MPQGRKKVPFSTKQKKLQLQAKRQKKAKRDRDDGDNSSECSTQSGQQSAVNASRINQQPSSHNQKANPNRYVLQFYRETDAELRERKELACKAFEPVPIEESEIDIDVYFPFGLDFPKRPSWNYEMSKEELEVRENEYFQNYISTLKQNFDWNELSYFELNLETWRQLWRVLEMSDIILFIVDIRYPALMFPPSLYRYTVDTMGKEMILILNKIDLLPASVVVAWKHYFKSKFPSLHILTFTSFPTYNLHGNLEKPGLKNYKRKARLRMAAEGAQKLMETCQHVVGETVNLTSWKNKIMEEMTSEYENDELEIGEVVSMQKVDTTYYEHTKYRDGLLTIGCVGHPNVGKSSLMNAIMGKKVVSVSKTPGHTKHFQTIFLTTDVKFCDCPGLVFPSKVPKSLQILMGSYPIAQVREPYTTIRYIAERIDLVKLLHIKHPNDDEEWSAIDICDGWAKARGFLVARSGRTDTYRAANHLLRMALDGKICLNLRPINYASKEEYWNNHPDVKEIMWIQASNKSIAKPKTESHGSDGDGDDECDTDDIGDVPDHGKDEYSSNGNESDSGAADSEN